MVFGALCPLVHRLVFGKGMQRGAPPLNQSSASKRMSPQQNVKKRSLELPRANEGFKETFGRKGEDLLERDRVDYDRNGKGLMGLND